MALVFVPAARAGKAVTGLTDTARKMLGRAGRSAAKSNKPKLKNRVKKFREKLLRVRYYRLLRRPKGVPDDWVREAANKKIGVKYIKPSSGGGTYVRISKANPDSIWSSQRVDNAVCGIKKKMWG